MGICEEADESLFCPVQGCDVWMCFEALISSCRAVSQSCAELLSPRPFPQHPTQAVSFSRAPWCREARGVVWMEGVSQSLTVQYELSGFPGAAYVVCVCVSVCGVGFLLLQGLWVWAIPGGNGKGKRKAEGVSLRVLALTQPCVRPKIADLVDVVHVVSDFECNQREKGAGESVWMPWKWGKSSSIHRLQGCDQINCERVKSGKL